MKAAKFLSNYLKATMFEGKGPQILTVRAVKEETVGTGDNQQQKLVVYFKEIEQGLVLNKTNGKMLIRKLGDETEDWIGKQIELYTTEVEFQGETQLGIRIRL